MEKTEKQAVVKQFATHAKDTGSTEVQVALLTRRIAQLTDHLQVNRHDHHSRRGMLLLVGQRRRLLAYIAKNDLPRYHKLISELGLRK